MNPNPPTPDDDELERDERELAALYRRLPHDEPGPELDAAVLAMAERAAAQRPRRHLPRWAYAAGSAAALVLVAGLAWHLQFEPPRSDMRDAPGLRETAPAAAARAPAEERRTPSARVKADAAAPPAARQATKPAPVARRAMQPAPPPPPPAPAAAPASHYAPQPQLKSISRAPEGSPRTDLAAPAEREAAAAASVPRLQRQATPQSSTADTQGIIMPSARAMAERAQVLLHQGRTEAARTLVRRLRVLHPNYPLPAELARLLAEPAPATSTPGR